MKKLSVVTLFFVAVFMMVWAIPGAANAEETLRYSCSAQVFEAFGTDRLEAFTKETGIKVDLHVSSSGSAVYRLMNDYSDIASAARGLYYRQKDSGYIEIPFCKDPLAVITNTECPIDNITSEQLKGIFSKRITNWKEVGGQDQRILVIIPDKETGAYKNFERMVMEREEEILYDYTSFQSTMVLDAIESIPCGISFIAQGGLTAHKGVKAIKVNGLAPRDKDYPYSQTFYYITKGEPAGPVKAFIDFTLSEKGIAIMKEKGIVPIKK